MIIVEGRDNCLGKEERKAEERGREYREGRGREGRGKGGERGLENDEVKGWHFDFVGFYPTNRKEFAR